MKLIKNKSGVYSVRFLTSSGKYSTRSLGVKDRATALKLVKEANIEELETAARVSALRGDVISSIVAGKKISVQFVLDEWKNYKENLSQSDQTIYTQESLLNAFFTHSGVKYLHEITTNMISAYINNDDSAKSDSRSQRLSAINSLFQFSVAKCYIPSDISSLVAVDKSKLSHKQKESTPRVPFTEGEYHHIMRNAPYFMRQATAIAWWTGLRLSDIARLEWDSIDPKEMTFTVHTKKRDARICLPLNDPLIGGGKLLEFFSEIKDEDKKYCFPEQCALDKDPRRRSTISVYYGRMLTRLGIEGKSFHCHRHAFVSRCQEVGKSLEDIALWVGHSSQETTQIYAHSQK